MFQNGTHDDEANDCKKLQQFMMDEFQLLQKLRQLLSMGRPIKRPQLILKYDKQKITNFSM